MFKSLSQFFGRESESKSGGVDEQQQLRVATCVLLLEVAHADDEFSAAEQETIDQLVAKRFRLDAAETAELLALAEKERSGGDLYSFARLVNENYSRARKLAVLELLWEIVYSDGVLEAHEDALMHKLGTLLGIRHEELMALKVQVRKNLDQN